MHTIYGSSLLTIVAVSGISSSSGLPGLHPNTRPLRHSLLNDSYELVAHLQDLTKILKNSLYETRGWTLQERLLSPRCLYITHWGYFFACLTETCCEAYSSLSPSLSTRGNLHDPHTDAPNSLLRMLAVHDGRISPDVAFRMYGKVIQEFSRRTFTDPRDRINGITGINTVIAQNLHGSVCGGYPARVIDWGLLWIPTPPTKPQVNGRSARNDYFPSWGWAGCMSPVNFDLATEVFVKRDEVEQVFSCRPDLEQGKYDQWIDFLDISAPAVNSTAFTPGIDSIKGAELEYPAEILDLTGKLAGVLFDAEIPLERRQSTCWLLGLFLAGEPIRMIELSKPRFENLSLDSAGLEQVRDKGDVESNGQVIVLLVEDKGEYVERMGVGIIALSAWEKTARVKKHFKLL